MLKRGDKIYLDKEETKESVVNNFLTCRDGIIYRYEYYEGGGYGQKTRLYLCKNTKHESIAIVIQSFNNYSGEWNEESMFFDCDSFKLLESLIQGKPTKYGDEFEVIRDYSIGG